MEAPEHQLLNLLSDGEVHSGQLIASVLGVSRTAVWKHLRRLSLLGLPVESVRGKGYQLKGGIELLSQENICDSLDALSIQEIASIDVRSQVDSTNQLAMSRVQDLVEGLSAKGYVCIAEYQKSGKGRRGREWVSPFGHNIYLSLVWEFDGGAVQLEGLSLAVGVVVANVLSDIGVRGVSLKWPNDILLNKRKLGGILLEMAGDPVGCCHVVIGIGLNVKMPVSVEIDQPWACLYEQQPHISRNRLVAKLLNGLTPMLKQFHSTGFVPYQRDWDRFDEYRNAEVLVSSERQELKGIARGVFDNGALKLEVNNCEQAIYGGEISLRLANAP